MASPKLPLASLWASPFRPFCAIGMAYGVLLMAAWLAARAGWIALPGGALPPQLWHGHEMLFGFAAAIVCATVLTALPGWAGTPEIRDAPLAGLVVLWLAGRAAFWAIGVLPAAFVAVADGALWVALLVILAPQLARVTNRYYLLLLPVLAGMLAGTVLFVVDDPGVGIATAVWALVLLYVLKAGVFTPVFTGNHLRATGRGDPPRPLVALECASIGAIVVVATLDLGGAPASWRGAAAFAAFALHALRLARWQGWKVRDEPLLWAMHAGYAWLVAALLLLALAALGVHGAARAWLHAFTVGALGSMMLSLMTRVALRHTGRPLAVPPVVVAAYTLIQLAALARVGAALAGVDAPWVAAAGLAWIAAFAIYLRRFGGILVSPSLPRAAANRRANF